MPREKEIKVTYVFDKLQINSDLAQNSFGEALSKLKIDICDDIVGTLIVSHSEVPYARAVLKNFDLVDKISIIALPKLEHEDREASSGKTYSITKKGLIETDAWCLITDNGSIYSIGA